MNDYDKLSFGLYIYAVIFILWALGIFPYNPIPFFWK